MFFRCGRGACGWSFLVGFASGVCVCGGGVLFSVFSKSNLLSYSFENESFLCWMRGVDNLVDRRGQP